MIRARRDNQSSEILTGVAILESYLYEICFSCNSNNSNLKFLACCSWVLIHGPNLAFLGTMYGLNWFA